MPKKKTRKCAAKRVRLTAAGRVRYVSAGRGHLLGSKSRKRKRHLRKAKILGARDEKRIRDLL